MSYPVEIFLKKCESVPSGTVKLTSSKSESNRVLIIQALAKKPVRIIGLSEARDTQTLHRLLNEDPTIWDVGDAGTTMRFSTAFLATQNRNRLITGTPRMQQRPIGVLVEALNQLGARVSYEGKSGFPPLRIEPFTTQASRHLEVPGNISSQFVSALLMIAPTLPDGLQVRFTTEVFSRPYIEMTLSLMKSFGVEHSWKNDTIYIEKQEYKTGTYEVESDWSGASYWYSLVALGPEGTKLMLPGLRAKSNQGDQKIAEFMKPLGVQTSYQEEGVILTKSEPQKLPLDMDFLSSPDLAQTVLVTAAGLNVHLRLTGLESLRIKETDRIAAMQQELEKIGARLVEENGMWQLIPGYLPKQAHIRTYDDHRMAMAFAPLSMKLDLTIEEPAVVRKSYPIFWEELQELCQ